MNTIKKLLPIVVVLVSMIALSACAPGPAVEVEPTETETTDLAEEIYAEYTAEAEKEEEIKPSETPTPESDILFEDDFSGLTSPYDYSDSDVDIKQEDGVLKISSDKKDWIPFAIVPGYDYDDMTINFEVTTVEGDPEDGYGVFTRVSNTSAYMFEVTYDGYFSVWLWESQDGFTPITEFTRSTAIDTGLNKTNRVSVTCNGNQLIFMVNDVVLANLTDDAAAAGDIQLFARNDAYSNVEIQIDNLEISKPDESFVAEVPEADAQSACMAPGSISESDVGKIVEVCGEITNWGDVPCPDCALGGYSYLTLDGAFTIISYEWLFNNDWVGDCIRASDTVEMLGIDPVFVYGKGEGYAGSECTTGDDGVMTCSQGDYFEYYSGCK